VDGAAYDEGDEFDLFENARRMRASKVGIAAVDAARDAREQARVARREAEARRAAEEAARKKAEEETARAANEPSSGPVASSPSVTGGDAVGDTALPGSGIDRSATFDVSSLMAASGSNTGYGVVIDVLGRGAYALQATGDTWSVIEVGELWCDAGQSGTFSIARKAPGVGNACGDGFGAHMSAFSESFSPDVAYMMGHETIIMDGYGHWLPTGICAGDIDLSGTSMEHGSDGSVFVSPDFAAFVFDKVPVGSTVIVM
jgi:hypothetical protein